MPDKLSARPVRRLAAGLGGAVLCWSTLCAAADPAPAATRELVDLSLEELRDVVVSSVSRREQPLLEAPASIFVISGDEIRRLGIQSLPEALRLAPNLQVAAIDARQYAISARGFNSGIANKLLVMQDGRTIYSPLFSGVFWDELDFVAAGIDRIEVISGPAGATWGTNAVNGVINIVTLPAASMQGVSVALNAGNRERSALARVGGTTIGGAAWRAHVGTIDRAATLLRSGAEPNDALRGTRAGLRIDWASATDALLLDAGVDDSRTDDRPTYGALTMRGGHVLARWTRRLDDATDVDAQAYYDHRDRRDRFLLQDRADVLDVETKLHHRSGNHRWLVGGGLRHAKDDAQPGLLLAFVPPEREERWTSVFLQDEVTLAQRLQLTLGARFERNPYTGWENMPSVRLAWKGDNSLLWGALSRAVRSPARLDREIYTPPAPPYAIAGGTGFRSEIANVAEVGYRAQMGNRASWSATAFVQDYDRLRSTQVVGSSLVIQNGMAGSIRGIEAWGQWQPTAEWQFASGLLYMDRRLRAKAGSNDPVGPSSLGNDPHAQWQLRSTHRIGADANAVFWLRHVGALPDPAVAAYTAVDLQLNWRLHPRVELAAGVRNAFDKRHVEFDSGTLTGEIPRALSVSLSWSLP